MRHLTLPETNSTGSEDRPFAQKGRKGSSPIAIILPWAHPLLVLHRECIGWKPPWIHLGVSKNSVTPKSSILIGLSIINHPFWGVSLFLETPSAGFAWECVICLLQGHDEDVKGNFSAAHGDAFQAWCERPEDDGSMMPIFFWSTFPKGRENREMWTWFLLLWCAWISYWCVFF